MISSRPTTDSRLRLTFKDGSFMTMGEKANLHLDKFDFDAGKRKNETPNSG